MHISQPAFDSIVKVSVSHRASAMRRAPSGASPSVNSAFAGTKRQPLDGVDGAFSFHVLVGKEVDVAEVQERFLKEGAYVVAFSSAAMPAARGACDFTNS